MFFLSEIFLEGWKEGGKDEWKEVGTTTATTSNIHSSSIQIFFFLDASPLLRNFDQQTYNTQLLVKTMSFIFITTLERNMNGYLGFF